jgi:hypothetical protein
MLSRTLAAVALAVSVVACTSQGADVHPAPLARAPESLAVLRVERTVTPSGPSLEGEGGRAALPAMTNVDAVFARFQGLTSDDVLELLGTPARSTPLSGCRWDASAVPDALPADAVVDLLDVGALHVEIGAETVALRGRLFPSVQSLLAGTIYAERLPLPAPLDEGQEVRFIGGGAGSIGPLEIALPAPAVPTGILVGGAPLEGAEAGGGELVVDRGKHLSVVWDAGDPRDRVEIELRAGGRHLRCGTTDEGSFQIRMQALAALPPDETAQITVGRVRRESLDVAGIDEAWARLVSRRAGSVALR